MSKDLNKDLNSKETFDVTMEMLKGTVLDHIDPPEALFGVTYFAHMIPPFEPEHTLMLGYGHGVVANLMRKIWGLGCKITAVDLKGYQTEYSFHEHKMEQTDAFEYVNDCTRFNIITKKFDYIAVDLWQDEDVCPQVYSDTFARKLKKMSKGLVCVNHKKNDMEKMLNFYDAGFSYERFVAVQDNRVSWWKVK